MRCGCWWMLSEENEKKGDGRVRIEIGLVEQGESDDGDNDVELTEKSAELDERPVESDETVVEVGVSSDGCRNPENRQIDEG